MATTTSTSQEMTVGPTSEISRGGVLAGSIDGTTNNSGGVPQPPLQMLRRRSSSFGLAPSEQLPAVMQIIGCINDFGLGLTSWW
jgi:hypothetical protein